MWDEGILDAMDGFVLQEVILEWHQIRCSNSFGKRKFQESFSESISAQQEVVTFCEMRFFL